LAHGLSDSFCPAPDLCLTGCHFVGKLPTMGNSAFHPSGVAKLVSNPCIFHGYHRWRLSNVRLGLRMAVLSFHLPVLYCCSPYALTDAQQK